MTARPQHTPKTELRVDAYGFDDFEVSLLAITRHFLNCLERPETQSWQFANSVAVERWGIENGLILAHLTYKVIKAVLDCRPEGICYKDALCPFEREVMTADELSLMQMLHHMRRDNAPAARDAADRLGDGRRDPYIIQAGLGLANRFPSGLGRQNRHTRRPALRVV